VSLLRTKSLKPPRRLTGPNKARASGRVTSGQTGQFAGPSRVAGLPQPPENHQPCESY
jgi:hypothetical protein